MTSPFRFAASRAAVGPSGKNPINQVQWFARDITDILGTHGSIFEIMRMAAKRLNQTSWMPSTGCWKSGSRIWRCLSKASPPTPIFEKGLDDRQATETVWAIASPEATGFCYRSGLGESAFFAMVGRFAYPTAAA